MTIQDGLDPIIEPAEISGAECERGRQLTLHSFLFCLVTVLLLNSDLMVKLSRTLPLGPLRDTAEVLAETWNGRMATYGMDDLHEQVERRVREFRVLRWDDLNERQARGDRPYWHVSERIEHREI